MNLATEDFCSCEFWLVSGLKPQQELQVDQVIHLPKRQQQAMPGSSTVMQDCCHVWAKIRQRVVHIV